MSSTPAPSWGRATRQEFVPLPRTGGILAMRWCQYSGRRDLRTSNVAGCYSLSALGYVHTRVRDGVERISSEAEFLRLIQRNPAVREILDRLDSLNVPDAWLASGCLFQTVWNVLAGDDPARAIKDYDVFYYDRSDTSVEAEERVAHRAATLFSDLDCAIDIRNQARVHTWYESEFGVHGYPELTKSTDGIDHFLAVCCMVAVRREASGDIGLYAPFGVDDVLDCVMRQNPWYPNAPRDCYEKKAARWSSLWPALRVVPHLRATAVREMPLSL